MSSYYARMICGMFTVDVLFYFLKHKRNKEGTMVYGERQLITRGRSFQYAYMALIALLMLYASFEGQAKCFVSPRVIPIVILLLPGLVLFTYCLFHDVYWSLRGEEEEKRVLILQLAMALLLPAQSPHQIIRGGLRTNGRYLTTFLLPLLLGILFTSMLLLQCIKYMMNHREGEQ